MREDIWVDDLNFESYQKNEIDFIDDSGKSCCVHSLSDRLKEEQKKVVKEAKKLVVEATCYDTEEEARNHLYDMSASEVLEILDQIERGE